MFDCEQYIKWPSITSDDVSCWEGASEAGQNNTRILVCTPSYVPQRVLQSFHWGGSKRSPAFKHLHLASHLSSRVPQTPCWLSFSSRSSCNYLFLLFVLLSHMSSKI
ncbi:hypothetical protein XPA_007740 [Xanthoria parietina]